MGRMPVDSCFIVLVCGFPVLGGCSGKADMRAVHVVTGEVLIDKAPQAGVEITLYPVNEEDRDPSNWKNGYPRGVTDDNGAFAVSTYGKNDGAPKGTYLVLARWLEGSGEQVSDRLRGRYFSPEKAMQRFEVQEQGNQLSINLSH